MQPRDDVVRSHGLCAVASVTASSFHISGISLVMRKDGEEVEEMELKLVSTSAFARPG